MISVGREILLDWILPTGDSENNKLFDFPKMWVMRSCRGIRQCAN